jgi:hypothetical protein
MVAKTVRDEHEADQLERQQQAQQAPSSQ